MKRWVYFSICIAAAAASFAAGRFLPVYLRAVDAQVLQQAGLKTFSVVDSGLDLVQRKNISSAELLLKAAQQENIPGHEKLRAAIDGSRKGSPSGKTKTFTEHVIQTKNREIILGWLRDSSLPAVQQLLRCHTLTNTVLFPPPQSPSGQAFDAALVTCGRLLQNHNLTRGLTEAVSSTAEAALRGESTQPLEQILFDFLSLGQRFTWEQLVSFCENIEDAETLRLLANFARSENASLPELFSAVQLSGNPAGVAKYLMNFGQTGQKDLAASLHFGAGGVRELLQRNLRLHPANVQRNLNAVSRSFVHLSWEMPRLALGLKWLLYFFAGYLLALGFHFARPRPPIAERPFHVQGFHVAREFLFALGFLLVVLLLSEPFLTQETQKLNFPIRLQLPTVSSAAPAETINGTKTIMNKLSLLTLLLFFVLQALLYVASLVKLAEIRRQRFPANVKLRLLENEEHLFDAGLYLGFAGTIISLILVSMGVIKPSLMAAYSATAFGVIFVSIFKIFHVRPLRRNLLIETESAKTIAAPAVTTPLSTSL